MKIAIPVERPALDSDVAAHFGRAAYFLIYDDEKKEALTLNNAASASQGGAGIKAAQTVVDAGAQALIAPRCGENAAKVLNQAGIALYQSVPGTALENIDALADGKLEALSDIHPGFHHKG